MGCVDKNDHMTNTYSISKETRSGETLFFHLLDLIILNSCILLTSCSSKLSHRDFRLSLVRDLIEEGGTVLGTQNT
jgi:hypothetical protein